MSAHMLARAFTLRYERMCISAQFYTLRTSLHAHVCAQAYVHDRALVYTHVHMHVCAQVPEHAAAVSLPTADWDMPRTHFRYFVSDAS